jgi:heme-degrading monooxygenase HmoA
MIAVIFELHPRPDCAGAYFDLAAALRQELEGIEGFISVERFRSVADPGKLLSLSFFRDEAAVRAWRAQSAHRAAQAVGRRDIFADYRLRIAEVTRDYGLRDRCEAPEDSRRTHG